MNKYKKIILFIVICTVISCYSFLNVFAEGLEPIEVEIPISASCQALVNDDVKVANKYNPRIEVVERDGSKQYKISIDPSNPNDSGASRKLENVRFKLTKINNTEIANNDYVIYYRHPLYLDYREYSGDVKFYFENDPNFKDPDCTDQDMKTVKIGFYVELESEGDTVHQPYVPNEIAQEDASITRNEINCSSPSGEFEVNFCIAKGKAQGSQSASFTGGVNFTNRFNGTNRVMKYKDIVSGNQYTTFKCDSSRVYTKDEIRDSYYTPTNVGYLYGSGTFSKNFGQYSYHFDPNNVTHSGSITCKVRCEEAVTVQYGVPVASKAGLCFEYKVKVTSRVLCNMTEAPQIPRRNHSVCTPSPTCTGVNSKGNKYMVTEGGPNSRFDSCIMSCDGGKYSSECSKKCYKEVYHNNMITYNPSKTYSVSQALQDNINNYGGYYFRSGGSIYWSKHSDQSGRWYRVSGYPNENSDGCKREYFADDGGFCRHDYGRRVCQDICWWDDCPSHSYLNPYFADADYESNMEKYNNAVRECKAAASCSTSQAEFTITVDYKDKSNTVKTINFPYDRNVPEVNNESAFRRDKSCSKGAVSSGCTDTKTNANTTIYQQDGCYNQSSSTKNIYMVEWGFPGSWVNKKTGELSYLDKPTTSGWQRVDKKFCLPFDAQNVNEKWWNYYYTKVGMNPKCPQNTPVVDEYNIRARSTDFGYFGWRIGVNCFYAVNNSSDKACPPAPEDKTDKIKYVVRSVDLENLFPATDGSSLTTSDSVGRTPGFNWSDMANNSKNPNYTSFPLAYAKYIQEKGYSIYSEDNLDYEFYLSPEVLKRLKGSRENDYTAYTGDNLTDANGVIRYKSNLFRGSGAAANNNTAKKIPGVSQLKCNNLGSGTSCQSSGY